MFSVTCETIHEVYREIGEIWCLDEAMKLCAELSEKYPSLNIVVYNVDLCEGYTQIYAMRGGKVAY